MINKHDPYLEKYIHSLVLENKVSTAINLININRDKKNTNFFDAYLLLILDDLKKNDFKNAYIHLARLDNFVQKDRFRLAILETLKQYVYVFKEKKISENKKNFGKLSNISETFQRCYLNDKSTNIFFSKLINDPRNDYSRYTFFYLSYLIENNKTDEVNQIINEIDFINTKLLLSQGKSWIENNNSNKLTEVFSCKNHNDIVSEFFFLISNVYSSEDNFEKSNFYLNLSNFLNPKFVFNLSLVVENQYFDKEYKKVKKTLKNFKKEDKFYYWYKVKKETQIISKLRNKKESLNYIRSEFDKIEKPNKNLYLI